MKERNSLKISKHGQLPGPEKLAQTNSSKDRLPSSAQEKVDYDKLDQQIREQMFDQQESSEQKMNFDPLINYILDHNYFEQDEVGDKDLAQNKETKQIPDRFKSAYEYYLIFQYLFINECKAKITQTVKSFKKPAPENLIEGHISLKALDFARDERGFFPFSFSLGHVKRSENDPHPLQNKEFDPTTTKNHLVLISSSRDFDIKLLKNVTQIPGKSQPFLFLAYLVPPLNPSDISQFIRLETEIDPRSWLRAYPENKVDIYLTPFEKISTFAREFLAIKNLRYNKTLSRLIYSPGELNQRYYSTLVDHPGIRPLSSFYLILSKKKKKI